MNELMIAPERAGPLAMANEATVMDQGVRIANVLKDIIKKQGLISKISGREYVRCEGWTTLGAMLGVVPREREVKDLGDGSYEAYVELVQMSTGNIIGGASAICGTDEAMWKSRPNYARRSMAVTRATSKAFRISWGWVMTLAGYESTPAEEIPGPRCETQEEVLTLNNPSIVMGYQATSGQKEKLKKMCLERGVGEEYFEMVSAAMIGRAASDLDEVLNELNQKEAASLGSNVVQSDQNAQGENGNVGG